MNFTFEIWGKCNSGVPVVCEQWCDGDLNKNTDFQTIQTYRYPLELGKKDNLFTILTGKYCFYGQFFIYYLLMLVNVYVKVPVLLRCNTVSGWKLATSPGWR